MASLYLSRKNLPPTPKKPKIELTQDAHEAEPKIEPITPDKTPNPPWPAVVTLCELLKLPLITKKFIIRETAVRKDSVIRNIQSLKVKIDIWKENVLPGMFFTGIIIRSNIISIVRTTGEIIFFLFLKTILAAVITSFIWFIGHHDLESMSSIACLT